jgi:hypothetical protein
MDATVIPLAGASHYATARVACRRSIRAWRERLPERRRHRGVEGPAASACAGAGATVARVAGTGPGLVDRHGWSLNFQAKGERLPLGPILGVDHHRDVWWKADL